MGLGFTAKAFTSDISWEDIQPGLETAVPKRPQRCTFISCADHNIKNNPHCDLRCLFYGIFFENQTWQGFNIFEDRLPTLAEL
jgi:hypothetical protein